VEIVPVLDVMGGVVVRGIAGRRAEYAPVRSRLVASVGPLDVARAFRTHFGLETLYLADLDAITGTAAPALPLYAGLDEAGFALWVDAGIRNPGDAASLMEPGIEGIVAGLETLAGPEALAAILREHGARILFSLDLKAGVPLARQEAWPAEPWDVAELAVRCGAARVLLLDLARVGTGGGTGTEELCGRLARTHPHVEVWAGGGVRGREDLERLRAAGVARVLLASALHDGAVSRADVEALRQAPLDLG
jgi:phosphoribosylformimino-5-aminoimidazole carboxamide ribotide isomerase